MDKETIKQQNSMRDVLSRYGMIPNFLMSTMHSQLVRSAYFYFRSEYG